MQLSPWQSETFQQSAGSSVANRNSNSAGNVIEVDRNAHGGRCLSGRHVWGNTTSMAGITMTLLLMIGAAHPVQNGTAASRDGVTRATRAQLTASLEHAEEITFAAWSPCGTRIATVSHDTTPYIGMLFDEALDSTGERPRSDRSSLHRTVKVWDIHDPGKPIILHDADDFHVGSVWWSPDGTRLVSLSFDGTTRVWNADGSGEPILLTSFSDRWGSAVGGFVAWSPDGTRILTYYAGDSVARIWNADGTGSPILLRHTSDVAPRWSPCGMKVLTVSLRGPVHVWLADGSEHAVLPHDPESSVDAVAWSPDGKHIVAASRDGTARVWNADGSGEAIVLRGDTSEIVLVAWSPNGTQISTLAHESGKVRVWNMDTPSIPVMLPSGESRTWHLAWCPKGARILATSMDGTVQLWDAQRLSDPVTLSSDDGLTERPSWSPNGERVVTVSVDGKARIWSSGGSDGPVLVRGEVPIRSAMWSPNGAHIATMSGTTLQVWALETLTQ